VIERMLQLIDPSIEPDAFYLEPSAGLGRIARVLVNEHGVPIDQIDCVEQNEDRVDTLRAEGFPNVVCMDFLQYTITGYDRIYMNPPFEEGQDMAHAMHAYDLLADGGGMVSVLSEGAFFRSNRKATEFQEWFDDVHAVYERLPERAFPSAKRLPRSPHHARGQPPPQSTRPPAERRATLESAPRSPCSTSPRGATRRWALGWRS